MFNPVAERKRYGFRQFWPLGFYYYNNHMLKYPRLSTCGCANGQPSYIDCYRGSLATISCTSPSSWGEEESRVRICGNHSTLH